MASTRVLVLSDNGTTQEGLDVDLVLIPENTKALGTLTFNRENPVGNSGTGLAIPFDTDQKHYIVLTANTTLTFNTPKSVGNFILRTVQDATGGRTITWPANLKWPGGVAPTISSAANAVDIFSIYYNGSDYYGTASLDFS